MPAKIKAPYEVLEAIEKGKTDRRIRHLIKPDGTQCSVGKTPAMVITRRHTSWVYYCFRCKMFGEVPFDKNTPKQTLKLIKANKARAEMNKDKKTIRLPEDFTLLTYHDGPIKARNWLWSYGIGMNMWKKHDIGWSDFYQRVIFPLRADIKVHKNVTIKNTIMGWIARDVDFSKEDNKIINAPKYLTKTQDDDRRKFFMLNREGANAVVIVEDILSAIKVFEYGGNVNTLALLNSSIDNDFILSKYKGQDIKIWLDQDMRARAVMNCIRLRQIGFNVHHIYTMGDPKECSAEVIKTKCEEKIYRR